MKVRKLAVALALAGGLGSGMANALGLGEIELQSWLNEPLDAEISLRQSRGVNPADVFVNVAPEAAYQRVGLERNQFLSKLRFEVVTGPDGGLAINVSSREPLREPYLNFLLELTWPSGRLMREYAVLVDPPVYAEESGVDDPVTAPSTSRAQPRPDRSAESLRRQAEVEGSVSRTYSSSEAFGPTGPSDTLWSIAQGMRPDSSVSVQQVMLAIQDENPNAFMDGNINRLKRGEVLRVPSSEQIRSRGRVEANRIVVQQNQAFQSPEPVDATTSAAQTDAAQQTDEANGDSELKLLVADEETTSSRDAAEGGSAGGDGDLPGGQDAGSAVASEELDALRRQNEELDSRLNDMQDQVQTLRRLLELKDSQLADLQEMAADSTDGADTEGSGTDGTGADSDGTGSDEAATDVTGEEPAVAEESPAATSEPAPASDPVAASEQSEAETAAQDAELAQAATSAESSGGVDADQEPQVPVAEETDNDVQATDQTESAPSQPVQPAAPAQKPFPGNIINAIMSNPMYQIALGGGLILLLLLLMLMMRRRASKEKAFFDQFAHEEDEEKGEDSVDLNPEDDIEAEPSTAANDALAEADNYLAYGQHVQAAQALETAISREPSRTDLRVKLLGVYADSQDRESFEKQYGELAALEDEAATAQADNLRARLDEAESAPSIDDLESQLRSDTSFYSAEEYPEQSQEHSVTEEFKANEYEASLDDSLENEFGGMESDASEETNVSNDESEFDLSLADLDESEELRASEEETETTEELSLEEEPDLTEELSSFELDESPELDDMSSEFEETVSDKPEQPEAEPVEDDLSLASEGLDDSFLDELDAELDKVSGDEELSAEPEPEADATDLNDLDMELSDEDLAIMDELSDSDDIPSLDEEVAEAEGPEQPAEPEEDSKPSALDLDENDLGDDDDFDFLAGTDEAATKLDLALAYVEMGDSDGARDILEEVALEGNDEQKAEAQELLKNLS